MFSRSLTVATRSNVSIERNFDADAIHSLKKTAARDILIGGAELAGLAIQAGLVDECHVFVHPVIVGRGKAGLHVSTRANLELLDTNRFYTGVVHVHYRITAE